ncbi:MAG TPA: DoxX family protein [Candidatus Aquilonibacter sp.]|nr:DoxX family protein [Candidatus Aquilonibacter sp.]
METTARSAPASKAALWSGRVISGLVVLFMVFDGVTKVMKVQQVIDATIRIGFPLSTIVGIGITLLVCVTLYVIPRTSILGAILLTGYFGGATAANIRAQSPLFNTAFAVGFGVLTWLGLYLRDRQLRALVPVRS